MYERHKRRYSLCDISKVDRTVDVVLLKVRGHTPSTPKLSGSSVSESSSWIPWPPYIGRMAEKCACVNSGECWVGLVILRFLAEYLNRNSGDFRISIEPLTVSVSFYLL